MKKQVSSKISILLLSLVVIMASAFLVDAPFDPDIRGLLFEVALLLAPVFGSKMRLPLKPLS